MHHEEQGCHDGHLLIQKCFGTIEAGFIGVSEMGIIVFCLWIVFVPRVNIHSW